MAKRKTRKKSSRRSGGRTVITTTSSKVVKKMVMRNPVTPSIRGFLDILSGHLTQYDMRLEARGDRNIYRLGHYLAAVDRVRKDLSGRFEGSDQSPAALNALKKSIDRYFIVSDMPPARKTIKAIDEYLATGKPPKYPIDKSRKKNPRLKNLDEREKSALGGALGGGVGGLWGALPAAAGAAAGVYIASRRKKKRNNNPAEREALRRIRVSR